MAIPSGQVPVQISRAYDIPVYRDIPSTSPVEVIHLWPGMTYFDLFDEMPSEIRKQLNQYDYDLKSIVEAFAQRYTVETILRQLQQVERDNQFHYERNARHDFIKQT